MQTINGIIVKELLFSGCLQEMRESPSAKLSEIPRQDSCKVSVTCYEETSGLFLSLPLVYLCTLDFLSLLTHHALQTFLGRLFSFTSVLRLSYFLPFPLFLYLLFLHLLHSEVFVISSVNPWFSLW